MKLVLFDDGAGLLPRLEPQQREQFVVERNRDAHVPDRDLDVIDDWFHTVIPR